MKCTMLAHRCAVPAPAAINAARAVVPQATAVRAGVLAPQRRHQHQRAAGFAVRAETEEAEAAAGEEEPEAEEVSEPEVEEEAEAEVSASAALIAELRTAAEEGDTDAIAAIADKLEVETSNVAGELATANTKIGQVEEKLASAKDQYLRLNADFDNYRKRSANEKDALASSVRSDVTETLLPLIDNFELAASQIKPETEGEEKINGSYQGLYKQMVELFKTLGVEAVETVGTPFDPEQHDAIMREESSDVPDGTILEEFRKGFAINGKLIRAAMVKVSFNDSPADASEAESESEAEAESE